MKEDNVGTLFQALRIEFDGQIANGFILPKHQCQVEPPA